MNARKKQEGGKTFLPIVVYLCEKKYTRRMEHKHNNPNRIYTSQANTVLSMEMHSALFIRFEVITMCFGFFLFHISFDLHCFCQCFLSLLQLLFILIVFVAFMPQFCTHYRNSIREIRQYHSEPQVETQKIEEETHNEEEKHKKLMITTPTDVLED